MSEKLTFEEINAFLQSLKLHNEKFSIGDFTNYKIYYKAFRWDYKLFIRKFLNLTRFKFLCTAVAGWGLNKNTIELFNLAQQKNVPFFLIEDGFIRSLYTFAANCPTDLKSGISYVVDTKGFYFDCNTPTDLEAFLNDYDVSTNEKKIAQNIIHLITANRISKYNSQPLESNKLSLSKNKNVLIIDQSYGDMSLIRGGITDEVFLSMIKDAVNQNPDAQILFKVHPDTIARNDISVFKQSLPSNIVFIDWEINPIVLLEHVDKVYVATSGMGMEALLLEKEVHCYGMPFYAGWGLTIDRLQCSRRKRKLTIEELFYITYIKYSHYINPLTNTACDIETAIKYILGIRKKHLGK